MTLHILNGDALKDQFPPEIEGEIIVAREALVDGPVNAPSLGELFKLREKFISTTYNLHDYAEITVPEITKITGIERGEVNLWFEDDLFCQVNMWFVCSLIYNKDVKVSLVRPNTSLRYGFGGLDSTGLVKAFKQKQPMSPVNVNQFALLWFAYRKDDIERLLKLGVQVHSDFPFVMKAIEAHFERNSEDGNVGRPHQIISEIMSENSTADFGTIFGEFNKRAPIYGYGDLQVRRIYDEVLKNQA